MKIPGQEMARALWRPLKDSQLGRAGEAGLDILSGSLEFQADLVIIINNSEHLVNTTWVSTVLSSSHNFPLKAPIYPVRCDNSHFTDG